MGNAVILHGKDTLYGHSAKFNFNTGKIEVNGNVRYTTKDINLYGSVINYNIKDETLLIENARLFTPTYRLVARNIQKKSENEYIATQAEFTTCKDCSESWTIYGEKVSIILNKYVYVSNALMRIKGADAMYLPYIVFPIKTDRETGVLFPSMSNQNNLGFSFSQPWFWAINGHSDFTFTPTIWTEKGLGTDLEYRYFFNDRSFYNLSSRYMRDRDYRNLDLNQHRYFLEQEFHYQWKTNHNFHILSQSLSDLDFSPDHNNFVQDQITSTEFGGEYFYDYRATDFSLGVNGQLKKTLLKEDSSFYNDFTDYSDGLVNPLFSINLGSVPFQIYKNKSNFFNSLSLKLRSDLTQFSQNNINEPTYIRNALRFNSTPQLKLSLFNNDVFKLTSTYSFDFQYYKFRDDNQIDFKKNAGLLKHQFSFSVDKVYGKAYKQIENNPLGISKSERDDLLGEVPDFSGFKKSLEEEKYYSSYKHVQNFMFTHHLLTSESEKGNERFYNQIQSIQGWFDFKDSIRSKEYLLGTKETALQVSPVNTLEFNWNHSLIKKTPKSTYKEDRGRFLNDNYDYTEIFFLNFSQGLELHDSDTKDFRNRLSRLGLEVGTSFSKYFILNLKDYYFHADQKNILEFSLRQNLDWLKVFNDLTYNELSNVKIHSWGFDIAVSDQLNFLVKQSRDLASSITNQEEYYLNYLPENDCWLLSLGYQRTINQENFSIDFALNFGNPSFFRKLNRIF